MLPRFAVSAACAMRMREHEVLHDELDVDHAACVVLEVERSRSVGMPLAMRSAHGDDVVREARRSRGMRRIAIALRSNAAPSAHRRDAAARASAPGAPTSMPARAGSGGSASRLDTMSPAARRAQPQVGVVQLAGGVVLVSHALTRLREPRDSARPRVGVGSSASRRRGRRVEVRRVAELLAAERRSDHAKRGASTVRPAPSHSWRQHSRSVASRIASASADKVIGEALDGQRPRGPARGAAGLRVRKWRSASDLPLGVARCMRRCRRSSSSRHACQSGLGKHVRDRAARRGGPDAA
jgi:hypothetical protein